MRSVRYDLSQTQNRVVVLHLGLYSGKQPDGIKFTWIIGLARPSLDAQLDGKDA